MSKRNTSRIAPDSILTLALDIGYGVVKAVTDGQTLRFPSVMGHARDIKFQSDEIARRHPGDQLFDDQGGWFVGDLALTHTPPGELLRLRGRTANEEEIGNAFRLRLAKVALGKLLAGNTSRDAIHVRIATGLPTDHLRDTASLKQTLLGQHRVCTDTADFIANIVDVMVMPQPYGTIYAHTLTERGEINRQHQYRRTGVVDVGTYTVDLALDDEGEYVDSESGSVESGVYTAHERIEELLERNYREKIPFKFVEETLRSGIFYANGQAVDYRSEVQDALMPLRSATMGLLSQKWQRGTTVDVVYLSGGGASLVAQDVRGAYPQTVVVEGAQLANARGYLNYARFAITELQR